MYIQQIAAIGVFGLSGGWLIAKAAEWCHKTKMEKSIASHHAPIQSKCTTV